ncbi:MAG: hypothetical protein ACTHJ0_06045 [Flavipsychrobacter sp.]
MNDGTLGDEQSINLHDRLIRFSYVIDPGNNELAVAYSVYLTDGEPANGTPIGFIIKKCGDQWETGSYSNEKFVAERDIISEGIKDAIIRQDSFFSQADKRQLWQSFSLDTAHGKFRFSPDIDGYQVAFKQKNGFLENSDELLQDEAFIIIKIGDEWLTCKVLAENSREIFSTLHTNEIKDYILQTHIGL